MGGGSGNSKTQTDDGGGNKYQKLFRQDLKEYKQQAPVATPPPGGNTGGKGGGPGNPGGNVPGGGGYTPGRHGEGAPNVRDNRGYGGNVYNPGIGGPGSNLMVPDLSPLPGGYIPPAYRSPQIGYPGGSQPFNPAVNPGNLPLPGQPVVRPQPKPSAPAPYDDSHTTPPKRRGRRR